MFTFRSSLGCCSTLMIFVSLVSRLIMVVLLAAITHLFSSCCAVVSEYWPVCVDVRLYVTCM